MKRLWLILFLSFVFSCEDKDEYDKAIQVEMKNSEIYKYKTGINGDEEGTRITKQAEHFEISEIIRNDTTKWEAVYRYKPQGKYVGNDYVEINTDQGSNGANPSTIFKKILIEFTITNK